MGPERRKRHLKFLCKLAGQNGVYKRLLYQRIRLKWTLLDAVTTPPNTKYNEPLEVDFHYERNNGIKIGPINTFFDQEVGEGSDIDPDDSDKRFYALKRAFNKMYKPQNQNT